MSFKRKPPNGSIRRPQVKGTNLRSVITNKVGRLVQCESAAQYALLLHLDRDPQVYDYATFAESVLYHDTQGNTYSYVPPCMVWRCDGQTEIHTISPSLLLRQTSPNSVVGQALCQAYGWRFVTHDGTTLTTGCTFPNLLALFGYRPRIYAQPIVTHAALKSAVHGPCVLQTLVAELTATCGLPASVIRGALCHLLWHGMLATDLNRLLLTRGAIAPHVLVQLPAE